VTVGTGPYHGKGGIGSAVPVAEVGRVSTYQSGQPGQPGPSWCQDSAILNMPRQHELPRRITAVSLPRPGGIPGVIGDRRAAEPRGALREVPRHTEQTSNGASGENHSAADIVFDHVENFIEADWPPCEAVIVVECVPSSADVSACAVTILSPDIAKNPLVSLEVNVPVN
jgi:hypothetical protein